MLTVAELLTAAKTAQGIPSNYRLARVLGVPDGTVTRWNTGKHCPDDATAIVLAEMAGLDPAPVLASLTAHRSTGAARSVWVGIAERLQRAGVAAALAALGITFTGGPDGGAMASQPALTAVPTSTVCILCK